LPHIGKKIKIFGKSKKAEEPRVEAETTTEPTEEFAVSPLPLKVYLKAMPLRELEDVDTIKREVKSGNILVIRVTPLAKKSIEDVKRAVNELSEFVQSVEGDIARLGEERVVVTPNFVQIWRRSTVSEENVPTAA
jgi:SepF-like predicted cell division protein (DUF552 family)